MSFEILHDFAFLNSFWCQLWVRVAFLGRSCNFDHLKNWMYFSKHEKSKKFAQYFFPNILLVVYYFPKF